MKVEEPSAPPSALLDLGETLRAGALSAARTVRVIRQVAAELDRNAEKGRYHGNIRPDNIQIDARSDLVHLRGFRNSPGEQATVSADYAAPEQIQRRSADRRVDIYALGCVAYQCLTGAAPYPRATEQDLFDAHVYDRPPRVSRPGIPDAVNKVIQKALAKQPEDRYDTCTDLADALEKGLTPPSRWWSRGLVAAVVVLVVLAAVVLVYLWPGDPPTPRQEPRLMDIISLPDCRPVAPGNLPADFHNVIEAIECSPPGTGANTVLYYLFANLEDLQATFDDHATAAHAPTGVSCVEDPPPSGFLGNRRHDVRSADLGGLLCHPGPQSTLIMEWSVEPLLVLGRAIGTDREDLSQWWLDHRGPSNSKTIDAYNADSTPPFPTAEEKALLGHIPPQSAIDCTRPSENQVNLNVPDAQVVAGVVCGAIGAGIVFYYQFPDQASMVANYDLSGHPQGPDCTTMPKTFAGEAPYAHDGFTGRLLCDTNEGGRRFLTWTNNQLRIQAFAFLVEEPVVLFEWWRREAGPR